jgi:hypothetical protein
MIAVPQAKPTKISESAPRVAETESLDWVSVAAAGSLFAGGLLLLTGNRRSGTVAAASGAALALLDQQDILSLWWNRLPGFIDEVQHLLGQVQGAVEDISVQRERLRAVVGK